MMKPAIQFASRSDKVKIAYATFGAGPVLLCPAAWVTDLAFFLQDPYLIQFWSDLADQSTVVLYDKHGCGQSDRERTLFTLETELLDLETIVQHLGIDKFSLFGLSMAGAVAIAYAASNPSKVQKLVLYGSYAKGRLLSPEDVQSAVVSLVRASWGLGSMALADLFLRSAPSEVIDGFAKFQRESATAEIAANLLELTYSIDVSDLLPAINMPTLILHRKNDRTIPLQHGQILAQGIPNALFRVLDGPLHFPWLGNSEEVTAQIIDFLAEAPSRRNSKKLASGIADKSEIVEQTTIVFTDIVSSTELVTEIGDVRARDLFLTHDKLVRHHLGIYAGNELQNLGDGFMLSFSTASAAIQFSCVLMKEFSEALPSIQLRIGINTGEVIRRTGKHPFGQAVVIASRIAQRCDGSQILVSDVSRQLVTGIKFEFIERGKFRPKGINEEIKVFEVNWSG